MFSEILIYAELGFKHITDVNGYDHILFVIALCATYLWKDWPRLLWLITAFTIGHSITLALAALNLVVFSSALIEALIPLSIIVTAIGNFWSIPALKRNYVAKSSQQNFLKYGITLFFGLIHGLGFSNYLRSLLAPQDEIVVKLLAFNIGLEIGQLLIVCVTLLLTFVFVGIFNRTQRDWNLVVSGATAGAALVLLLERI